MITTNALTSPFATLVDLILPLRCAGCEAGGAALCPLCRNAIEPGGGPPAARYHPDCPAPVHAIGDYQGRLRTALLAFKERDRRDVAVPLGEVLADALPRIPSARPARDGTWWLVPAPSRAAAARRRGGSHLLRLARATAAALAARGQPAAVAPALRFASGVRDSVGLDRVERAANLAGRVRLRDSAAPPVGTPVILLDDVVTTGATARACVRELNRAGRPVSTVLALAAAGKGETDFSR